LIEVLQMTSNRLYWLAGWLLLVGVVCGIVALLLSDLLLEGSRPNHAGEPLWTVVNLLAMIGGLVVVLAMTGVYVRISAQAGWPGLIGWALLQVANIMISMGLTAVYLLAVPVLGRDARRAFDAATGTQAGNPVLLFSLVGLLALVVGVTLFGFAIRRARVFPSWTGWALIVAGIATLVATIVRGAQPAVPPIVADSPILLLEVTQCALGWWLVRDSAAEADSGLLAPTD
jgi:hypothetical protein